MIKIKNKRGGKRKGAGRKPLPGTQKMVKISTVVNPNIRKFLDGRVSQGHTIAETVDFAIRTAYPEAFEGHFTKIKID